MNRYIVFFTLSIVFLLLSSCGNKEKNDVSSERPDVSGQTETSFALKSEKGLPMVVDFSASWCGPCHMLKPVFEEVEKKYAGRIDFMTIDIDSFPDLAEKYGIQAVPTIVFINATGEEKDRSVGFVDKIEIEKRIEKLQ